MNRGLLLHKGGELFHKKTPLTENEILEKELTEVQEYVTKERERRKAGLPFGHSPLVEKEGTSEGAKLGWETRRGGQPSAGEPKAGQTGSEEWADEQAQRHFVPIGQEAVTLSEGSAALNEAMDTFNEGMRKVSDYATRTGRRDASDAASVANEKVINEYKRFKTLKDDKAWMNAREKIAINIADAFADLGEASAMASGRKPMQKEGTSEGAKAGWETRRGGGTAPEKPTGSSKAERMGIQNPDSSGMGSHPDHDKHPLHETLANAGLEYSHSVAVNHGPGDDRVHHAYKLPGTDRLVGVHQTSKGDWMWESGKAGSGRMRTGKDAASLTSHLKRAEKGLDGDESVRISKDEIEKIMKDGGWDKLPLTDRAREIVEDAISRGAKPATEYTGKLLVEHAIPEEPPAFTRPKNLKVGDTVIPLNWVGVCTQGAKFDLPSVPEAFKVKKMYTGPAKVTKNSYPYGRYPSDISKVETVMEDRLWGLELDDRLGKEDDGTSSMPISTRDTTLVLRLDPQATPSGEVNPGVSQRD
jgi:hypothetical protein